MSIKNNGVINHPKRVVCGIAVDIYSIMMTDLYDPSVIPGAWKKFWTEFPKSSLPGNSVAATLDPMSDSYVMGIAIPVK